MIEMLDDLGGFGADGGGRILQGFCEREQNLAAFGVFDDFGGRDAYAGSEHAVSMQCLQREKTVFGGEGGVDRAIKEELTAGFRAERRGIEAVFLRRRRTNQVSDLEQRCPGVFADAAFGEGFE